MQYVAGFLLDGSRSRVVLVRKNRPAWQAGFLNGVGGKVEYAESVYEAMSREFEEEAGLYIPPHDWENLCTIRWAEDDRVNSEKASVTFFRHVWQGDEDVMDLVRPCTDEAIEVWPVHPVPDKVIPNLSWLVPLAAYAGDKYEPFIVNATVEEVYASVD